MKYFFENISYKYCAMLLPLVLIYNELKYFYNNAQQFRSTVLLQLRKFNAVYECRQIFTSDIVSAELRVFEKKILLSSLIVTHGSSLLNTFHSK